MSYVNTEFNEIKQETIAENIKNLRGGLSRKKFEEEYDIPEDSVYDWEKRGKMPQLSNLIDLCNKFGCDLDYLTGRIKAKTHDADFVMQYTGLSEDAVNALHEMSAEDTAIIDAFIRVCHDQKESLKSTGHGYPFINGLSFYLQNRACLNVLEAPDRVTYKTNRINDDIEIEYGEDWEASVIWSDIEKQTRLQRFEINEQTTALLDAMFEYYSERFNVNDVSAGDTAARVATKEYLDKLIESYKESGRNVIIKE